MNADRKKIVLVEDDVILSGVLTDELKDAHFEVLQAFNGQSGLELVQKTHPDLVLLDILLPHKNGLEVLKTLKQDKNTSDIPVFLLTMLSREEDITLGMELGAKDYIVKSQHTIGEIVKKVKDFFPVSGSKE